MAPPLTKSRIRRENLAFAGTGGVSPLNRSRRFLPAFRDEHSGRVELARHANGNVASLHVIEGLPTDWIIEHDAAGHPSALKPSVVAGFVRDGLFFTREQTADLLV